MRALTGPPRIAGTDYSAAAAGGVKNGPFRLMPSDDLGSSCHASSGACVTSPALKHRVEAWPAGGKRLRQRFLRSNISRIGRDHPGLIAQNALCFGERFRVTTDDGDMRPFGEKTPAQWQANAAGFPPVISVYLPAKRPMFFS